MVSAVVSSHEFTGGHIQDRKQKGGPTALAVVGTSVG